MLLNRRNVVNVQQIERNISQMKIADHQEEAELIVQLTDFLRLNQIYEAALNEVATKLENLDAEFQVNYNHNPIHHIEARMKSPQSIIEKVERYNIQATIQEIKDNIMDIAGIRVIANYIQDVYTIEKMLLQQHDVRLIKRKDYIKKPKANGYRSLHIVVSVPVFLSTGVEYTNVEIQIRTITMDMWASLEHRLRYKQTASEMKAKHNQTLEQTARDLFEIEERMQAIHHDIHHDV